MTSPIFPAIQWISKSLIVFISLVLVSCASTKKLRDEYSPIVKVYHPDFEKVWRAAQIALKKYPLKINNIDKGLLETDLIKGYEIWTPPYKAKYSEAGLKYRIVIRTIRGKIKGQSAVKVVVFKEIIKKRDFFAESEKLPTDGLEETMIQYRIGREIQIDNALEYSQEKSNY